MSEMTDSNDLPVLTPQDLNPVPVFSCHVILGAPDQRGTIAGRTANLPDISAHGATERDVLTSLMKQFKDTVGGLHERGESIPFLDPPESPGEGEVERFIPVHL